MNAVQGLREGGGVTGQGSGREALATCDDTRDGRGELHKAHSCMRTLRACPVQGVRVARTGPRNALMWRVRRRGSGREASQGREVAGGLRTLVWTPPLVGGINGC